MQQVTITLSDSHDSPKADKNRKKQMSETIYDTAKLKDPSYKRNFSIALKNSGFTRRRTRK